MLDGKTIAVVVPAYNEAGFVGRVIDSFPAFVDRAYVVDDCSSDETWTEMCAHAAAANAAVEVEPLPAGIVGDGGVAFDPRIVTVRHEVNQGRGAAVKNGYRRALADGIDVVAVMDADGQMDPDILHEIVGPVLRGEADYTVGNRLSGLDSWTGMPPFRLFGNVVLTLLTRAASGYWTLSDPQNGYTAISREALDTIDVDALYDGYGFLNDVLMHLNVHGLRVRNVPMRARYGDEESGIRYSSFIPKLSALLLNGSWDRLKAKYCRRRAVTLAGAALVSRTQTTGPTTSDLADSPLDAGDSPCDDVR
jgi:glycosyltransferase involved in cell wall biosynthesis